MIGQRLSEIKKNRGSHWSSTIGRMHYRSTIIEFSGSLLISSCGEIWNKSDSADGVYSINPENGFVNWHSRTHGDSNEIKIFEDTVIGGTDNGEVFAIDAHYGERIATHSGISAFCSAPIIVKSAEQNLALMISIDGYVLSYDNQKKYFSIVGNIPGRFVANLETNQAMMEEGKFFAASESGHIYSAQVRNGAIHYDQIYDASRTQHHIVYASDVFRPKVRGIASMSIVSDRIIISYTRDTEYIAPPLVCIDLYGNEIWHARGIKSLSKRHSSYGNGRAKPLIFDNSIFCTFSYSDSLYSLSLNTGRAEWSVRLDDGLFQNWASPVLGSNRRIYVPRVNGLVHEVDIKSREVIGSISAEIGRYSRINYLSPWETYTSEDYSDLTSPISGGVPLFRKSPNPDDRLEAGIASTPFIFNNLLIVGTVSGRLMAFEI